MSRSTPPWTPAEGLSHSIHNLGEAEALSVLRGEKISRAVQSLPRIASGSTNAFPHRRGATFRPTGQYDRGVHERAELEHRLFSGMRRSAKFVHSRRRGHSMTPNVVAQAQEPAGEARW